MKVVLTYGSFDLFHVGHLNLLLSLRALGGKLIVGVSTDQFSRQKGKEPIIPFEQRKQIVGALGIVDLVIPENSWLQKSIDIVDHQVDIFGIGEDWLGKFDELKELCEVVYLPRTKGISTTEIRNRVLALHQINQTMSAAKTSA